jgi:hypothetical protein
MPDFKIAVALLKRWGLTAGSAIRRDMYIAKSIPNPQAPLGAA